MKKRNFIKKIGCIALGATFPLSSESYENKMGDDLLRLNPYIWPAERLEKREYDNSQEKVVVWHTAPYQHSSSEDVVYRTNGFIEGASDEDSILYTPGVLVRQDNPPIKTSGFFIYFGVAYAYFSLPRRDSNNKNIIFDRYSFPQDFSVRSRKLIKENSFSIDFKDMRMIEGGIEYRPKGELFRLRNSTGALLKVAPEVIPIEDSFHFPSANRVSNSISIEKTLYFEIEHRPLRFKLILPPVVIDGLSVPLPTCYFEPYNIIDNEFV